MPETTATTVPVHKLPTSCHVCGSAEPHPPGDPAKYGHTFWSNADAFAEFAAMDARTVTYDPAAAYVAEHRPY